MTTEVAAPSSGVRTRPVRRTTALVVAGLAASTVALLALLATGVGRNGADPYAAALGPVVERHNAAMARWNSFVAETNAITYGDQDAFEKQAAAGVRLTDELATETQWVINRWDRIQPPEKMAEAHQLARDAMRETQNGFVEMGIFFQAVLDYGVAFDDMLQSGRSKLDHASKLWQEARAAAAAVN